ncbi:MAG: hypothetical protein NC483_01685 [Ruminococcus sp.]|nr:hypothetical protein [Ruminococcus sp.]
MKENQKFSNSKYSQSSGTYQEKEYKLVSEIKNPSFDVTTLVRVKGILYSKSSAILDYLGTTNKIGVVDKLIDSIYIPKLDFETNNIELLNSSVFEGHKGSTIVLYYNNEYVLFEAIQK